MRNNRINKTGFIKDPNGIKIFLLSLCVCLAVKSQAQSKVQMLRVGETVPNKSIALLSGQEQLSGQAFQQDMLLTYKGYQYLTYYNSDRNVCLARRKLPLGNWREIVLPYKNSQDDAHNVISVGICANDGTIHLAFDHHNSPLHYVKSIIGLANNPETTRWAAESFSTTGSQMVEGINVPDVTYPRFFNKPDGNLLFECRYKLSGNGDSYLREYDGATHAWTMVGRYVQGMDATPDACAYINRIDYDNKGRIHVSWCWRDDFGGMSNHDIYYAYSTDHGRTWLNTNGAQVASTEYMVNPTDATTHGTCLRQELTSLKIADIPYNRGYINQESQTTDTLARVHILNSYIPVGEADDSNWASSRLKARLHHRFRDSNGVWQVRQVKNNGATVYSYCRSQIIADANNNAIVIANGAEIYGATSANDYNDWGLISNVDKDRFCSEPQIDHPRLLKDGVLSFAYLGRDQKIVVIDYLMDNPHKPNGIGLSAQTVGDTTVYSGTLETLYGEQYTLYLNARAKVYVDGNLLLEKTTDTAEEISAAIPLIASHRHSIVIKTLSSTQPALSWSGKRTDKTVVPVASFYPETEKQSDNIGDYAYQPEKKADVVIPYLPKLQDFGGQSVGSFPDFQPVISDFTLEVSATEGTPITVGDNYFTYTPASNGLVRFAQKDRMVYVFEGDKYIKSIQPNATVEYPDIFAQQIDSVAKTGIYDSRNLFKNPGFERFTQYMSGYDPVAKPADVRAMPANWFTLASYYVATGTRANNITVNSGYAAIRSIAEGNYAFMLHGYEAGDGMKFWQQLSGIKPATPYRIVYRHIAHSGTVTGNYVARVGGFSSDYFKEYTYATPAAGFGNYKDVSFDFVTPGSLPAQIYFSISRTATSIGHFDRMTLVEGVASTGKGITGVASASYLIGKAYAPEVKLNAGEYIDMTSFIVNPGFSSNTADGWTGATGGAVSLSEMEFYSRTFDLSQQITGLPEGIYRLQAQGFHREKANDYAANYNAGNEVVNAALYANVSGKSIQKPLLSLYAHGMLGNSSNTDFANGYVNSMAAARIAFDGQLYLNNMDSIQVKSGETLQIGMKTISANVDASWTIFDNFKLFYAGKINGQSSGVSENTANGITDQVVSRKYYNLQGVEVARPVPNTVYIVKKTLKSGKIVSAKEFSR